MAQRKKNEHEWGVVAQGESAGEFLQVEYCPLCRGWMLNGERIKKGDIPAEVEWL